MRDERFERIAKALGLADGYTTDAAKQLLLELALENASLLSRLDTIAEYEGLNFKQDQPAEFKLTPKAKAELGNPIQVGELRNAGFDLSSVTITPVAEPAIAGKASAELIPDSALVAAAAPVTEEEVGF